MSIRANAGDKSKMNAINEIEIDGVKRQVFCRCEQDAGGSATQQMAHTKCYAARRS